MGGISSQNMAIFVDSPGSINLHEGLRSLSQDMVTKSITQGRSIAVVYD